MNTPPAKNYLSINFLLSLLISLFFFVGSAVAASASSPIAYWKLDEPAGATSFLDSSGSGDTGTCSGIACPVLGVPGIFGTAANFVGGSQYISIGNPADLNFGTGSFTYSLWVYVPASIGPYDIPLWKGGSSASYPGFDIECGTSEWVANLSDGPQQLSIALGPETNNQWVLLTAVVDRSAGLFDTYRNGVPVASASLGSLGSVSSSNPLYIGGISGYGFNGKIDDVRIYNTALSATDVANLYSSTVAVSVSPASVSLLPGGMQQFTATVTGTAKMAVTWSAGAGTISSSGLYTAPSTAGSYVVTATSVADSTKSASATVTVSAPTTGGLAAYWKLDEPAGASSFADSSGSGDTGTCSGTACPTLGVSGVFGTAANFVGGSQYISIGNPANLNFGTGSFTYSLWVYVSQSLGPYDIPLWKGGSGTRFRGFDIECGTSTWVANLVDGSNHVSAAFGNQTLSQWILLTAVVDRSAGLFNAYRNGVLVASASLGSLGSVSSSNPLYIGGLSGYGFNGKIDDVRIYNTALSPTDVANLYSDPPSSVAVSINPASASLQTGGRQQFTASVTGSTNTGATWSATGGTISSSGMYTAPSTAGTYTVKATSVADSTKSAAATVTVAASPTVAVSVSPASASLLTGGTQQFTATVTGSTNTGTTWSATGGTISSSGMYTAPSTAGTYTVKATSVADSTKSAAATVTVAASPTVAVSVSPASASLPTGGTQQFTASVTGSTNTGATWSATGGTISSSGMYTTPSTAGTYTVKATSVADSTKSAAATVTVAASPTIVVSVSPTLTSLHSGGTQQFTATVTGSTNTGATWSATGGTISSSGMYTAPSTAGTYTVKATSVADSTKSAAATVTVAASPTVAVSVSPASASLLTGGTQQFTASVTGSTNTGATWSATGGTISSSGMYTAPSTAGTYTVKATSVADSTKSAAATVTVAASPTVAVSVSPASASLLTGGTQQFTATVTGSTNTGTTWSATGGTISSSGMYTAPSTAGTYTVKATSVADSTKSAAATVTVAASPTIVVSVSPTLTSLHSGGTQQFTATVTGSTNTGATWSAPGGTISSSGMYTAPSTAGTYTVTATSVADSTKSASATVTVSATVAVSISPTSASLLTGGTQQFTPTVTGTTNTSVNWSTTGGTVSSLGFYTAPSTAGTYTVTATSVADSTKSASARVTVSAPVAVSISPASVSLQTGGTQQFTAIVTGSTNTSVAWSATGGSISSSGLYTAPSTTATYTVTATSVADTSKSASAVVTMGTSSTACAPLFGSYGAGNWPPACYQPYSATAWINRPLPPNPTVDPNSATIVSTFLSYGSPQAHGVAPLGTSYQDYDHPVYWSKATDPVYTFSGCGYSGKLNGVTFHALTGMQPGGGTDGHLTVMDQSTNEEYDVWQAKINDSTHTIGGTACSRLSINGDARVNQSVDGDGANAAITGLYSGQIRGVELVAGAINHAIAVVTPCTNGSYVYPAQGTAASGCSSGPADGQFFQVTYTDAQIDALSIPQWQKVVLHAMHQYGFYVDDTGANGSFWIHLESGKTYHAYGSEDPFITYAQANLGQDITFSGGVYYYSLSNIDWTHIQVIAPCVIQGTC